MLLALLGPAGLQFLQTQMLSNTFLQEEMFSWEKVSYMASHKPSAAHSYLLALTFVIDSKKKVPQLFFCHLERNHDPFKMPQQSVKNLSPGKCSVFQDLSGAGCSRRGSRGAQGTCCSVHINLCCSGPSPSKLLLGRCPPGRPYIGSGRLMGGGMCVCVCVICSVRGDSNSF